MVKRGLILGGVLVLFSGVFVSNTFADDNVDFSITVQNASLQLTVPPTANLDLTPTSTSADFKTTNLTIKVGTNNATGYTLTMGVPSTDISRQNAASGDPVIGTLGSQTGGYSENDFTVNKWGYRITGDNYFPITTTLAPSQWVTDGPANNVDNTITLASKINTAIPAGTYKTILTFSAVANPGLDSSAFTLIYNPNGGTGTMLPTTITYGQSGTISSSTFTAPTGYEFDGWASSVAGAGPYYDANTTYTAPADATGETYKVLYAIWRKTGTPTPSGGSSGTTPGTTLQRAYEIAYTAAHKGMYEEDTAGSGTFHYVDSWNGATYEGNGRDVRFLIQDMTPEICASATALDSEALVLDIRDQTSYHIIKARDGRCWMQDNLALDAVTVKNSLSPTNTNATQAAIDNFITDSSVAPQIGWATTAVSYETGSVEYNQPRINITSKNLTRSDLTDPDDPLMEANSWKFGVYYNYCAASIGTYCYASNSGVDTDGTSAIDVKNDICPAGWRMPTGLNYDATSRPDGGEYQALYGAYPAVSGEDNAYIRFRKTFRLPLSGYFGGGSPHYQGNRAIVWSSTFGSDSDIYNINVSTSNVHPQSCYSRYYGFSVRCVAK